MDLNDNDIDDIKKNEVEIKKIYDKTSPVISSLSQSFSLFKIDEFISSFRQGQKEAEEEGLVEMSELVNVLSDLLKPNAQNRSSYLEESNDEKRFHKLMSDEVQKRLPKKVRGRLPKVQADEWPLVDPAVESVNSYILFFWYMVLYYFVTVTDDPTLSINRVERCYNSITAWYWQYFIL